MKRVNRTQSEQADDDLVLAARVLRATGVLLSLWFAGTSGVRFASHLAILGNIEDAEVAMQDAFIKAFRHLSQFRREARFTTWLTRIAVNEALQKRQARKDTVLWTIRVASKAKAKNNLCLGGSNRDVPIQRSYTENRNSRVSSKVRFSLCRPSIEKLLSFAMSKK
jgi:hypothetical protein